MDCIREAAHECRMTITQLCHKLGMSARLMAYYRKSGDYPPKLCVKIENMTNKVVTRQMLRPTDYQEIWPELGA